MKQYIDLLHRIIHNGRPKKDRTGTGTTSVFGGQMRFKMEDGFPLLVLKKTHFPSIVTELIWFLKGDTNIQWLEQNGCSIWREWPYKKYLQEPLADIQTAKTNLLYTKKWHIQEGFSLIAPYPHRHFTSEEFADRIKTDDKFAKQYGDLGPVYGKQWVDWGGHSYMKEVGGRHWGGSFGGPLHKIPGVMTEFYAGGINQIKLAIDKLKTFPEDRGIIVSAWNVSELSDMALRPCHAFFQFDATELTLSERYEEWKKICNKNNWVLLPPNEISAEHLDKRDIPKYRLSLLLYQRSCDTFLGVPFNIASYALLLHMVAQCVNMIPYEFIWDGGDIHVYDNHKDQCEELFGRWDNLPNKYSMFGVEKEEPPLPTIKLNPEIKDIFDFKIEDITLEGYKPMKSIKAPVAV